MKLFYAPTTISIASAIALDEAGIDYEPVRVDFASGEQTKPSFHAINPKGRVPALITEQGILTETGAILDYIAAIKPAAHLVPSDPWQAAQMRAVMYYLASTMHVNHAHRLRGIRWVDKESSIEDMKAKVPQTMTESARFINDHAIRTPFVMGDVISIADPYLFVVCSWLEGDGVKVDDFPKIVAFRDAMEARPSVKKAREMGML
ncbi:Glutathione S-transferase GST-6.0 [Roseovarius litorisediminis]|uniref:Glutathione S-transferase GST-6.0 n=1 Tax=Roseovarius litorisediminis TaxID=1312363 RepID=A0A1Y5RVT2_9RHOB|nr:glutathione S-transferase family protein [Roseovarius litorisediminis]SLN25336.1 Glutathione S-transferase GST-6.0 [Roseovarius litorisediminis]